MDQHITEWTGLLKRFHKIHKMEINDPDHKTATGRETNEASDSNGYRLLNSILIVVVVVLIKSLCKRLLGLFT